MAKLGTLVGLGILGVGTVAILRKREGAKALGETSTTTPTGTPEGTGEPPSGEPDPEPEPEPDDGLNEPPGPEGQGDPFPPDPQPQPGTFGGPTGPGHPGPDQSPPPPPLPEPQPQPGVFGEPTGPGESQGLGCEAISVSGTKLTDLVRYDEMTQVDIVISGFKARCRYQLTMAFCLATNRATFGWIDQFADTNFGPGQGGVPKEYGIKDFQWKGNEQFGGPVLYTPVPKKFRLHYAYKRRYEVHVRMDVRGTAHLTDKKAYAVTTGSSSDACPMFINPWPKPTVGEIFFIPGTPGKKISENLYLPGVENSTWKPKPEISWIAGQNQVKLRVRVAGIPHFAADNGKPYLQPYETTRYKIFYAVHAKPVAAG